jgi:hypothetical protein
MVAQDSELSDPKGEDNWRYVESDLAKQPPKPTLDGEPSYEEIPQGLHNPAEPYWTADDVRRYAYWSVFAGSCGHTYGHNAVMQMHAPDSGKGAYGVRSYWYDAIDARGAGYALFYTYTDRPFTVRMGRIDGAKVRAWWFDPRTGTATEAGTWENAGTRRFEPPGAPHPGNDWVLVLDNSGERFTRPGAN